MTNMALLKNHRGEYNYQFLWMNESGSVTGFNNVWATNKRDAVKLVKKMETKAGWRKWTGTEYVSVPQPKSNVNGDHYYNEGMYLKPDSMYRATAKQASDMDRVSWMMTC